jgi:hypothetical protein
MYRTCFDLNLVVEKGTFIYFFIYTGIYNMYKGEGSWVYTLGMKFMAVCAATVATDAALY